MQIKCNLGESAHNAAMILLVKLTFTKCTDDHQDLEEKIESMADDLRQERRRVNTATLERDRVEKMSARQKEMNQQLEERLEKEEHLSSEETAICFAWGPQPRPLHANYKPDRSIHTHGECNVYRGFKNVWHGAMNLTGRTFSILR